MLYQEHLQESLKRLREHDETSLYFVKPRLIEAIVSEVHSSLDLFSIKTKDSNKKLRCREKMHHEEGIAKVTEKLVKEYGEIYRPIILQEARAHVREDMGFIPKKADYKDPTFWPKWQAQHETQCAWI